MSDVQFRVKITYKDNQGNSVAEVFEVLNTHYSTTELSNPNIRKYCFYRNVVTNSLYSITEYKLKIIQRG